MSDVFIFLKLTRKYSLPHLVEPAIDIITTSEPMRTNFFGQHSEYTDYYFRAITHLLNDSHPALAARVTDTYHDRAEDLRPPTLI
ncbi:MAG: hypothetical protein P1U40_06315 [Coxiellaceae bacterium]|nr:hypothetical protein [Coxiellaceae bacterium]